MFEKGFRIIAVRAFQNCASVVMRALYWDTTYFLCNDYIDAYGDDGKWFGIRKQRQGDTIRHDFFKLPLQNDDRGVARKTPVVSVSAIVGKNGDGKSSLVELILRIINNFGIECGFTEDQDSLVHVNGVEAILYYEVNGILYYIVCSDGGVSSSFGKLNKSKQEMRNHQQQLFYTVVANYSIYAYNARHLQREVDDDQESWINGVFHKNDSYQTPLVLNPMRIDGNFDINKEETLCRQRLMSIYADLGDDEDARVINDNKIASGFAFNLEDESKLETVTMKRYFQRTWKSTSLNSAAGDLERQLQSLMATKKSPKLELMGFEYQDQVWFWMKYAKMWEKYESLFKLAEEVVGEVYSDNKAEDDNSETDLKRYLRAANAAFEYILYDRYEKKQVLSSLANVNDACKRLTGLQFQRLVLIIDVCELWSRHPWFKVNTFATAIKQYTEDSRTNGIERCHALLYVIYKTIHIFTQYRRFPEFLRVEPYFYLFDRQYEDGTGYYTGLPQCFDKLFIDKEKKHIGKKYDTLKLRQTINYLVFGSFRLSRVRDGYVSRDFGYENYVTFDRLQSFIAKAKTRCNEETIALLPPPIFIGDILIREGEDRSGNPRFAMNSLSSGELQMLNSISTYIYHLRNLNYHTRATDSIEYSNVNLVQEEVELYFHPEYQRQYVYRMLRQIGQARLENINAINIILVTHSPFVLSDIPINNVLFLKGGKPVRVMQENTFGANIHSLLQNGFFLEGAPIGEFAKVKINCMFERLHQGEYGEDLFEEIKLVSEPLLKTQLYQLYSLNKLPHLNPKYDELVARISELEKRLYD